MTWPTTAVDTTAMDAGTDTPPRAEFLSWAQKFNQIRAHVTTFMQGVLSAATAADARTALGAQSSTMSTARILGRVTAGSGAVEELTRGVITESFVDPATTTTPGKVELATDAEAQAATDSTRVVTPANLRALVPGLGQTWQNMTGSRASATTYTNTTGRTIKVMVTSATGTSSSVVAVVSGMEIGRQVLQVGGSVFQASVSFEVPPGATYSATVSPSISNWMELR